MKKMFLLIVAFILSIAGYSQTAEEYVKSGTKKYLFMDLDGAITDFTKALKIDSNYIDAYYLRGMAKILKDPKGAIADLTKVIEVDSNSTDAYFSRGNAKIRIGQKESACLDYTRAKELGNKDAIKLVKKYCK